MREQQKAAWERKVFVEAAAIASIEGLPESVESRQPPEPDILCTLRNGQRVAFELVELVDPDEPRALARSLRTPDKPEAFAIDAAAATRRNLRKHLENRYVSQHPME